MLTECSNRATNSWLTGEPNYDLVGDFEIDANTPRTWQRRGIMMDYGFDPVKPEALEQIAVKRISYADDQKICESVFSIDFLVAY